MSSSNFQHWKEQYEAERGRLIDALGMVINGGIVEEIQHIGATCVPNMQAAPCVDIGLAVWPFPLEAGPRSRLEALGYSILEGQKGNQQQCLQHKSGLFQLFIVEPGTGEFFDFVLLTDYLRHNDRAREATSARKSDAALDKAILFEQLLADARRWWIEHYGFSTLEGVSNELKDAPFPWFVAGGWALDLFLGQVQRVHYDVDVVVPRNVQMELQKYLTERGWVLITPYEKRLELWPPRMRLELPRHQVHAHRDEIFIDVLLTDIDEVWRYRREPAIVRILEKMGLQSESGIPYLAPELVLLFKSRNTSNHERSKDQSDFESVLPRLDFERRAWLRWALAATFPEHVWIGQLV
jgi:GrpB-like predicted nucleotidyltransferase (UPF0157 family)